MIIVGWILCMAPLIGSFTFFSWALLLDDTLEQVNSCLPQDKQFALLDRRRSEELRPQYKVLFPDGTSHTRSMPMWVGAAARFLAAMVPLVPLINPPVV
jgi:hypothetical protein